MLHSSSIKVLVIMQVDAWRKYKRAGNTVQNKADNANGDACFTN